MTKSVPLENLSIDDMLTLRDKIDTRLTKIVAEEMDALEERMAKLAEITQTPAPVTRKGKTKKLATKTAKAPSKNKGKKAPAKFRDPATGNSWSGRGLTPLWLRDYETKGGKRADLAV